MEKPIKEWLSELPEPYRTEAIEFAGLFPVGYTLDDTAASLNNALAIAFDWEATGDFDKWCVIAEGHIDAAPDESESAPTDQQITDWFTGGEEISWQSYRLTNEQVKELIIKAVRHFSK